jgi:hypothetical protein
MTALESITVVRKRKILIDIIGMLLIATVALIAYKLSPVWFASDRIIQPDPPCNLNRDVCKVTVNGGQIEFQVSPRPVPLLKEFSIEVRAADISIRYLDVDFAGVGMNMGLVRVPLRTDGTGVWRATTSLPVCVTSQMRWRLTLIVETSLDSILIPVEFSTPDDTIAR